MANGSVAPNRVIEGQGTKLSRTMHGIAFDAPHDEFIIPVALSGALLVFRGAARGEEAPIRVIQGDKTGLIRPHTVAVDPVHGEIFTGDPSARAVSAFRRDANGNVAPIRTLRGPATKLIDMTGVAVDPVHNLLVVGSRGPTVETTGLLIFNRTDNGDVAPRAIIGGEKSRLAHFRQIAIDPENGKIFVAIQNLRYKAPSAYATTEVREGFDGEERQSRSRAGRSPWDPTLAGFVGVWDIHDHGDVAPRAVIRGPRSRLMGAGGVGLDPQHGEVIAVDGGTNGYHVYYVPQFFRADFWGGGR